MSTSYYIVKGTKNYKIPVALGKKLGTGGEGTVYAVNAIGKRKITDKAVKIFHNNTFSVSKLKTLINKFSLLNEEKDNSNLYEKICVPLNLVYDSESGNLVGYLMERAKGYTLDHLLRRSVLEWELQWSRLDLCSLALSILRLFKKLHRAGVLMADINSNNIIALVDPNKVRFNGAQASFIDVDSYQIGGFNEFKPEFACLVGRDEFESDRIRAQHLGSGKVYRNMEDEYFAISTLLFTIFVPGAMPWDRVDGGSIENTNNNRIFSYPDGYKVNGEVHVRTEMRWHQLPESIRKTFCGIFQHNLFVSLEEWEDLILDYQDMLLNGYRSTIIFWPLRDESKRVRILNTKWYEPVPKVPENGWIHQDKDYRQFLMVEISANSLTYFNQLERFFGDVPQRLTFQIRKYSHPYFSLVEQGGYMNPDKFRQRLRNEKVIEFLGFIQSLMKQKPPFTDIHAFGTSFLRNLSNREEVLQILKEETGFEFRIYSTEEQARMLFTAIPASPTSPQLLLIQASTSLIFALRLPDGKIYFEELTSLGRELLLNWFLDSHMIQVELATSTETALHEHDADIEANIRPIGNFIRRVLELNGVTASLEVTMFGYQIKKDMNLPGDTIPSIPKVVEFYQSATKENREDVGEMARDIMAEKTSSIKNKLLSRLTLAVPAFINREFPGSEFNLYPERLLLPRLIIDNYLENQ